MNNQLIFIGAILVGLAFLAMRNKTMREESLDLIQFSDLPRRRGAI